MKPFSFFFYRTRKTIPVPSLVTLVLFTIDSQFYALCPHCGKVGGFTSIIAPMFVTHRWDHQGAAPTAERCCHDAKISGQRVSMEGPPNRQRLVAFRDNTRDLGKPALVEHALTKRQR